MSLFFKKIRMPKGKQPTTVGQYKVLKTTEHVAKLLKSDLSTHDKLAKLIEMPNLNKMSPKLFVGFTVDSKTKTDDLRLDKIKPEILGAMNLQAKFKQNLRINASGGSLSGMRTTGAVIGNVQNMQARGARLGALVGDSRGANIDNASVGYLNAAVAGAGGIASLNKTEDVPITNTWMSAQAEKENKLPHHAPNNVHTLGAYKALKSEAPVFLPNQPVMRGGSKEKLQRFDYTG